MQINKVLNGLTGRYIFLIVISSIVFFVLILQLAWLQLSNSEASTKSIQSQSLRRIRVPAVRGRIESSDGAILVDNKASYDLMFYVNEFRLGYAGKKTRTAEYMKRSLKSLADLLDLESNINEKEIFGKLHLESKEKVTLVQKLSPTQIKQLKNYKLPDFIVRQKGSISLDYSKVTLLSNMNWRDRTTERICREIDRVNVMLGRPLIDHSKKVLTHLRYMPALPYKALENLSPRELALISEMIPKLYGTSIEENTKRIYPFGEEYSHLLGRTRIPDYEQLDKEDKDSFFYYVRSLYGVNGIEAKMDADMKGTAGRKQVLVNFSGFVHGKEAGEHSMINDTEVEKFNYEPVHGNNVRLTLDHEAQTLAYKLLKNIPASNLGVPLKEGESVRGSFVLMDCQTGEIKAMVSTPSYDLNRFREREYYGKLKDEEKNKPYALKQQPLINRSLSAYEPGSIIKPLLALAGLEFAGLDEEHEIECEGYYLLPNGKKIRDASKWGHGPISLNSAIEQSCNKYFITLGLEMGVEKLEKLYTHAGLGRYPMALNNSSERFTQEKKGLIPQKKKGWVFADTAYSSIGQGKIQISPLQAAVFVGAIANGGKVLKPQLIKEILDSKNEKLIKKMKFPDIADNLPIKLENLEIVQRGMRRVVVGENASAKNARVKIPGSLELAGKTGTAEVVFVPKDEDGKNIRDAAGKLIYSKIKNTWFTAYAPYDNPKYVAICFVQGGIYGGTTCAPVVREFFDIWSVTKPKEEKKVE